MTRNCSDLENHESNRRVLPAELSGAIVKKEIALKLVTGTTRRWLAMAFRTRFVSLF